MMGAIAGDIIGSPYEGGLIKTTDFPLFTPYSRFTDDTVLTVATAKAILEGGSYDAWYRELGRRHPHAGYGASFREWLAADDPQPYNSLGNGSAMRVSPIGLAFDSEASVLREAERSASVTHNHPEGIKGAQATALAVFRARRGTSKDDIRGELAERFGYVLDGTVAEIRADYEFDVSCPGSVPEAIIAFLDSVDIEDAIRLAISLGGDSDTQAAIAGGIAQAFYRAVPDSIVDGARARLPEEFLKVVDAFDRAFPL
jgi:ADP-ribosylglycohydrolase